MGKNDKYYLNISRASDLKMGGERFFFRFLEIMPGFFSWGILILAILLSWKKPVWVASFIIIYTIYWLFRTIYFSIYLWASYKKMKRNERIDWIKKLDKFLAKTARKIGMIFII